MLDAIRSYLRRYNYRHPNHRRACRQARARSRGRCQGCGYGSADHGHHWALRYRPPAATTADDLTGLCWLCHRVMTLLRRFLSVGGDPVRFIEILGAALAETDDIGPRTGRCRRFGRACGACVNGRTQPRVGEVIRVTLRSGAWDYMIVTAIVDGEPGRWRVLTAWPKARENCSNRAQSSNGIAPMGSTVSTSARRSYR